MMSLTPTLNSKSQFKFYIKCHVFLIVKILTILREIYLTANQNLVKTKN